MDTHFAIIISVNDSQPLDRTAQKPLETKGIGTPAAIAAKTTTHLLLSLTLAVVVMWCSYLVAWQCKRWSDKHVWIS